MAITFSGGSECLQTAGAFQELSIGTVSLWVEFADVIGNSRIMGSDSIFEARLSGTSLLHEFRQGTTPTVSTVFTSGVWYHLVFQFDGTNKAVYVNGSPDPSLGPYTNGAAGFDTALSLGGSTWNPGQSMRGHLEDVRMYNRILTHKEVLHLYNSDGCDPYLDGLHHWWRLDNGAEGTQPIYEPDLISKVDMTLVFGTPVYSRSHRCF